MASVDIHPYHQQWAPAAAPPPPPAVATALPKRERGREDRVWQVIEQIEDMADNTSLSSDSERESVNQSRRAVGASRSRRRRSSSARLNQAATQQDIHQSILVLTDVIRSYNERLADVEKALITLQEAIVQGLTPPSK
ncbi:hypothetical protein ACLB2K_055775 [Fragaria x ananassa]